MNPLARSVKKRVAFGKPHDFRPGELQSEVSADAWLLPLETWPNLTQGLTPNRLKHILDAADQGDILEQHVLFGDMEDRCEHLAAEMGKRKRALLTLDWEILPGRENDKKAKRIAAEVREQFDALGGIEDLLMDLADAIGHGFSACEILWQYDQGKHLPASFAFRPQTWFQVLPEDRNHLRLRNGSPNGEDLWPFGWIVHTHRSRSGWLPRYGLFRTVAWAYLIRSFALEANVNYIQVHGLPFRLGKYPPGSSAEDKAALQLAMRTLGKDAAGIVPQGFEVLFETPANASRDLAGELVTRCEQGMSKAILGGTLTSQADGKTSTNALGRVHDEVRRDLMISDAMQIASTLSKQLVAPLAILNCGVTDPRLMPYFRFDTRQAADITTYAQALPLLAPVMRISRRWAHEKLKIPVAESEDDVLRVQASSPEAQDHQPMAAHLTANAQDELGRLAQDEQRAIDGIKPEPDMAQKSMESLLAPLLEEVRTGLEPAELMVRLADLYPKMDTTELEEMLARVLFVSDLWGEANAHRGM